MKIIPYKEKDLAVNFSAEKTVFKIWAPEASAVKLRLYKAGDGGEAINTLEMSEAGTLGNNYYQRH